MSLPRQAELLKMFSYDPATGVLSWRYRDGYPAQWNGRFAGKPAGGPTHVHGYIVVNLGKGKLALAHRIIWKMLHDEEPPSIDHVDGDEANNRETNLRAATHSQNMRNKAPHRGKVLPKGVSTTRKPGRYRASIFLDGKCVNLGVFDGPEAAHGAYCDRAEKAFGEFARFN
jgi:hypothetical protein